MCRDFIFRQALQRIPNETVNKVQMCEQNMKRDPTAAAGRFPLSCTPNLMIPMSRGAKAKNKFPPSSILLIIRVKNEGSKVIEETFWHLVRVCAGVSLEFSWMKRFFKNEIFTYNTIGRKFIYLKVDFRPPGVFISVLSAFCIDRHFRVLVKLHHLSRN